MFFLFRKKNKNKNHTMKFGYLTLRKCQPECFLFGNSVNGVQMAARGLATPPRVPTRGIWGQNSGHPRTWGGNTTSLFSPAANRNLAFPSIMDKGHKPGPLTGSGTWSPAKSRTSPRWRTVRTAVLNYDLSPGLLRVGEALMFCEICAPEKAHM